MSVIDLILHQSMVPFAISIGIVMGMLMIELILIQAGLSIIGGEAEIDLGGSDTDFDSDFDTDLDGDFDVGAEAKLDSPVTSTASSSDELGEAMSWLVIGKMPFSIWLAGMLTAFGLSGYLLQLVVSSLSGAPLPTLVAVPLALVPGIALGTRFAAEIGRIMPKTETTAISRRPCDQTAGTVPTMAGI